MGEFVHENKYAGEDKDDVNEEAEIRSIKHIHKIVDEKLVYQIILNELNKIDGFKNIGTLLHEFHEYAEPEYHKRMSGGDISE